MKSSVLVLCTWHVLMSIVLTVEFLCMYVHGALHSILKDQFVGGGRVLLKGAWH